MQQCTSALPWLLQAKVLYTHHCNDNCAGRAWGQEAAPPRSFPQCTHPLLEETESPNPLVSCCLLEIASTSFLWGRRGFKYLNTFFKTWSSARLNYFGALCHPKHVLGGSQSLPPVAAHPWLLWLMTLGAQSSSVCGPDGKRLQPTK